jgi:16S rRNA C1402 N4-methylase RsmH
MHYPVMLTNVLKSISSLNLHRKLLLADCNFGLGGHSNAILKAFPNAFMYIKYYLVSTAYDLD